MGIMVLRKSITNKLEKLAKRRSDPADEIERFRKLILEHLDTMDDGKEEKSMQKAFSSMLRMEKGGKGLAVGTVREWKGKKFRKIAPGKWRAVYDSETRGAKMAVSAIKRQVAAAKNAQEMMAIILENRSRFEDKAGNPLPFVQELSKYIAGEADRKEKAGKENSLEKAKAISEKQVDIAVKTLENNALQQGTKEYTELIDTLKRNTLDAYLKAGVDGENAKKYTDQTIKVAEARYDRIPKTQAEKNKAKYGHSYTVGERMAGSFSDERLQQRLDKYAQTEAQSDDEKGMRAAFQDEAEKRGLSTTKKETPDTKGDEAPEIIQHRDDYSENTKIDKKRIEKGERAMVASTSGHKVTLEKKSYGYDVGDIRPHFSGGVHGNSKTLKTADEAIAEFRSRADAITGKKQIIYEDINDYLRRWEESRKQNAKKDGTGDEGKPAWAKKMTDEEKLQAGIEKDKKYAKTHRNDEYVNEVFTNNVAPYWAKHPELSLAEIKAYVKKLPNQEYLKHISKLDWDVLRQGVEDGLYEKPAKKNDSAPEKTGIDTIREKYQSGTSVTGDEDEINVGGELIPGKWKLVEADAPSASHDEKTFQKTEGFPTNTDGNTVNDRDYERDKAAQEAVLDVAGDFDSRALSFDNPIVVSQDGVVVSGNNRTMSSKIAARKGTDAKYIEALKKRAKKFGLTDADIAKFKHPRVVFETKVDKYDTDTFAKYNVSTKKAMSPIETAVKVSKTVKPQLISDVAGKIADYETIGEFYGNSKATGDVFNDFVKSGAIGKMDLPQYYADGHITDAGKSFFETAMVGSVMSENNLRALDKPGGKQIRAKLVRAIVPLIENKSLGGYSINKELNEAVDIVLQAAQNDKIATVANFENQGNFFENYDKVSIELAKKLEGTQKGFADFMQTMNGGLRPAANGEMDIFLGNTESKDEILNRMLSIKKSIGNVIEFFRNLRDGKGPRFVKKAIPVLVSDGVTELQERWVSDLLVSDGVTELQERWVSDLAETINQDDITDSTDLLNTDKKTIAIDFDGVINSFNTGWRGPTETDTPVEGAAEAINTLLGAGYKVVIYSTRASTPEGSETIRKYLAENDVSFEEIEVTDKKPIAHIYIDDRAIPFSGDWSDTLKQISEFKPWTEKSLTWSGHELQGRTKVHGMDISIENKKGSTRSGTDKDGHDWHTHMNFDYGYIKGTVGRDKDHLDVYIGPSRESETVFIVHQNDPVTGKYDEDKVMLGFDSEEAARKAYLRQYDRPGFLGDIDVMDIVTFKEKAFNPANKGKMIRG